ncbi:MAG: hypothetical protein ACJ763_10385 [Bdellovibrionia bacterium]
MRSALWFAVAGLLISFHSHAALAPSDPCQMAAYRASSGLVPSGSVMTGIFSLNPPPNARDRSVGSVVMVGEISGHEFSIVVHVRYIRSIHTCQVLQVDNLDWGDHI